MKKWILILIALVLVPAQVGKASNVDNEGFFSAGASKVKITPTGPVYMAGFGPSRKSLGVHDDLYARCVTLKKGEHRLTLISLDLIGLLYDDVKEIVQRVEHVVGRNVIITSTHTHSGPDSIGWWGPSLFGLFPIRSGVDEDYFDFLKREVARAILEAASRMEDVEIKLAKREILGISKNIRNEASIDRELTVMGIRSLKNRKPMATLVNFACHPETLWSDNRMITADFPGYLCDTIEMKWGGIALYVNGALGGMVTVDVKMDEKGRELHIFKEAERIGVTLAKRSLESLAEATPSLLPWIRVRRREVAIPLQNFRFRLVRWLGVIDRPLKENRVLTEVWYMDLGDAQIVTVPGEMLPNLGMKLKEELRGEYRFLLGLANDELGYILSREDYYNDLYSYERSMSIGPETGPLIYKGLTDLISR